MNFIKKIITVAIETIKKFILELYKNILSVTILILSSCGLCTLLSKLPIEMIFIPISIINEAAIVGLLSIGIVYLIVSFIPIWEQQCIKA